MSTVRATNFQHASAANPAIVLAADGSATANVSSINNGPLAGMRNAIINGGMLIDQRNGGASQVITTSAAYTVDRWICAPIGASVTGQRVTRTTDNQFGYQITGAAGVTSTFFLQRIEAASCASLANTTVTLSALLSNSVLTTVNWELFYPSATDNFTTNTSIASGSWTVTSTDAIYTAQISIPAAATTGLQLNLSVGAQTSGTWIVSRVQLEPGPVATPFERRPIGTELSLCKRYFQSYASTTFRADGYASGAGVSVTGITFPFCVPMRVAPSQTGTYSTNTNINSGPFFAATAVGVNITGNAGSAGQTSMIMGVMTFSAEL